MRPTRMGLPLALVAVGLACAVIPTLHALGTAAAAPTLTVELSGMFAVVDDKAQPNRAVLLFPSDSGPSGHTPKLAINAAAVVREVGVTNLNPDETVITPDGQQLAVWDLQGRSLEIGAGGALTFNRQVMLPLQRAHSQTLSAKPQLLQAAPPVQVGRVTLNGGDLAGTAAGEPTLEFQKIAGQPDFKGNFAEALTYTTTIPGTGVLELTGARPGTIRIQSVIAPSNDPVRISLSNHAPQFDSGLSHFSMYYSLLASGIPPRVLTDPQTKNLFLRPLSCVPPVLIPK